jgi:hypothetical protein
MRVFVRGGLGSAGIWSNKSTEVVKILTEKEYRELEYVDV